LQLPTVSVVIPCYNQGQFLAEAIDSALEQSYPHVKVIVVNDGSTDNTPAVAARYGDRIQYIEKKNAGLSAARNTGILASTGEFVHFLDSDDRLQPDMLEKQMIAATANADGAVFYGSWHEIGIEGRVFATVQARPLPQDAFHALLHPLNVGPPCRYTVRRAALANVGLFDVGLKSCEDWDMWLRLAAAGYRFVPVPDAFAAYRNYPNSMSKNFDRMWRSGLTVLKRNRIGHGNCALCRRTKTRCIKEWRQHCYLSILRDRLILHEERGDSRAGVMEAARAALRDPLLAGLVVKSSASHLRRKLGLSPIQAS
jgi:glycosyltransferase involved in cell wall biosynthesis